MYRSRQKGFAGGNVMKYEDAKKLNDTLTEMTGVKHYPTIGEAFEAVFKEKGILYENGKFVDKKEEE